MQTQITERIEEAVNTVAGIDTLSSVSREGASIITAEFKLGVDLDVAASDIRDQLSRAARFLPADINPPILNKADADSNPIFGIALSSQSKSQLELGAFADSLRERLQLCRELQPWTSPQKNAMPCDCGWPRKNCRPTE